MIFNKLYLLIKRNYNHNRDVYGLGISILMLTFMYFYIFTISPDVPSGLMSLMLSIILASVSTLTIGMITGTMP